MTYIGKAVQEFKDAQIEIKVRFEAEQDEDARSKFKELLEYYDLDRQGFNLEYTTLERVEGVQLFGEATTQIPVVSIPV